ncbi:MAG: MFS transporter [Acidimicrobiia bacterium]|nr:MFS transporter [Acidimicrobiia bacterium]
MHDRRWAGLLVLCFSLLVIGLDNTILNVALPKLQEDLNATTSQLQWIIDGYTLVFAGLLLTGGALGDRFGRKGALQIGLVIFCAGSMLSANAGSANQLILTRSLMGVGGALIMPATLSLLTNMFTDPKERGRAIGVWAGVSGAGVAIGPLLGGWLLAHFWWGSVFLINLPVTIIALVAGKVLLPTSKAPDAQKLDPLGAALSIAGLVSLLWGIIEAPAKGWTSTPVVVALVLAVVLLGAFVAWELTTDHPMLDVHFFQNRRFTAASSAVTLLFFAMFGAMFLLTQFLQFGLGFTPLQAGLRAAPFALIMMAAAPTAPRLVERAGTKIVVVAGMLIVAVGLVVASTCTVALGYPRVLIAQLLIGFGIATAMAPATESIMGALPRHKAGVGSAMNDTTRQVGGALGVAVVGSVYASAYRPELVSKLSGLFGSLPGGAAAQSAARDSIGGAIIVAQRAGGDPQKIDTATGHHIADAARDAFTTAMSRGFLFAAVFALLGALVALLFLPARVADPGTDPAEDLDDIDDSVPELEPAGA